MTKFTADMAMDQEKQVMLDALCGGIELNEEFLTRYAGENVKTQLMRLPERDRSFYLSSAIDEDNCFFNDTVVINMPNDIWLDISEIEIQFEGESEDYFENLEDWTIDKDLAYLYVGYGLTIKVDIERLTKDINEALEEN